MGSDIESLSDVRLQVLDLEDRLMYEQTNLFELKENHSRERMKWNQETKELETVVRNLQDVVKAKEERLAEVKRKLEEIFYKPRELEQERERIHKENKKMEREYEGKKSQFTEDIRLRRELKVIQEKRKDLLLSNRWLKEMQKTNGSETDEEDGQELEDTCNEIDKSLKIFDQIMRDIDNMSLTTEMQRLQELHECRAKLEADCEEMEQKNKELEQKIKELEEEEPEPEPQPEQKPTAVN